MINVISSYKEDKANKIYNLLLKESRTIKLKSIVLVSRTEAEVYSIFVTDTLSGLTPVWDNFEIFNLNEEKEIKEYIIEKMLDKGTVNFHIYKLKYNGTVVSSLQITEEYEKFMVNNVI